MKKCCYVLVCIFVFIFESYSQSDCNSALNLCTDANTGGVVNGFGNDDFNGRTSLGCLKLNLQGTAIEANSYWFRIKLAESGQFGFTITPNNLSEDWDFGVFGPNATCGVLGTPVRCNYRGGSGGSTGVGEDPTTGTQTQFYDTWINAAAGDEYVIYVNQYSGTNAGFSIKWEGAVIDNNTDPLDCSILVDLGPDRELCVGSAGTVLNATIFGAAVAYEWFLENPATGVFEPMVPVKNTATLYVTNSGNYKVEVTDTTTGQVLSDDVVVTFSEVPIAGTPLNMSICDTNGDGFEDFNLELQTNTIIGGQTGMTVSYHESYVFALAGAAPQSSPYRTTGGTIYARIENGSNSKCYDVISFNVTPVPSPRVVQAPDLQQCDDDTDGKMIFDISLQTPIILDGQTGLEVTYYNDQTNAVDKKGWIPTLDTFGTQTIWVRVEPISGTGCYVLTSFDISVLASPAANITTNLQICDDNNDGYYSFDFNALKDAEILGSQNSVNFSISYFGSLLDANSNLNALSNPYTNTTPYGVETIYARISNNGFSACYDVTSFSIQVFDNANILTPSEIPDFAVCDDMSDGDDTNGYYTFNLTDYDTLILNGQSKFVFDVDYYLDAAYVNQISNPIAFTNSVVNGQTIFVRVANSNPNNTTCYSDSSFNIVVQPLPNALLTPFDFQQCDVDGTPDGITDFNLEEADLFLALGNTSLNVSYHLSPLDAASGTNAQVKFPFSNATISSLYGRVEDAIGCYRIVPINLIGTATAFPAGYNREFITCDDDAVIDGLHVFDLTQSISEIISLFPSQNLRVSFYRDQSDASQEINVINTPDVYLSETPYSQRIWVRVESAVNGGCFAIEPVIELTVNPRPEFELDDTDIVCLNNLPLTVSTYNPNDNYTYEWTDQQGTVISVQPFADISTGGVYSVVATSIIGCSSFPQTITISESVVADIDKDDIQISDNSSHNSITILNRNGNLGVGDYEFSLDDSIGPYQDSPIFSDLDPGEYVVYVRDKNNCGIAQVTVYVLGFPKFFTPNNDGSNDEWQVQGVNLAVFPESSISVYDRYGQFMSSFNLNNSGWDGTYGQNLEALSSDYWYVVELTDLNGDTQLFRGHFSLLRK